MLHSFFADRGLRHVPPPIGIQKASLGRLLLPAALLVATSAFELYVPDYGKQCFYEELEKDVSLSGTFVVLEGGDGTVDYTVSFFNSFFQSKSSAPLCCSQSPKYP